MLQRYRDESVTFFGIKLFHLWLNVDQMLTDKFWSWQREMIKSCDVVLGVMEFTSTALISTKWLSLTRSSDTQASVSWSRLTNFANVQWLCSCSLLPMMVALSELVQPPDLDLTYLHLFPNMKKGFSWNPFGLRWWCRIISGGCFWTAKKLGYKSSCFIVRNVSSGKEIVLKNNMSEWALWAQNLLVNPCMYMRVYICGFGSVGWRRALTDHAGSYTAHAFVSNSMHMHICISVSFSCWIFLLAAVAGLLHWNMLQSIIKHVWWRGSSNYKSVSPEELWPTSSCIRLLYMHAHMQFDLQQTTILMMKRGSESCHHVSIPI